MSEKTQCGYVAIVGRPNVGKSTLLNHLIEQKISITSRKPQTTRHNVTGIKTSGSTQLIFVDTPGQHSSQNTAINRYMNRVASSAAVDVDVVVFVLDRNVWTSEDELVLERLANNRCPLIVVVNKTDRIEEKAQLVPFLQDLQQGFNDKNIHPKAFIPVSALQGENLTILENEIVKYIPEGMHFYDEDQITDKSSRFLAAELIREKIVRQLGAELPYQTTVEIESFTQESELIEINALILVEREGQKRIIIGNKGSRLKKIGMQARQEMEVLFDCKVMLRLWIKVKEGWSDDDRALRSLGFND